MSSFINIEDFRLEAKRKLPKIFFDYIDGAAFSEKTMQRNRNDFQKWRLVQRILKTQNMPDLETNYLGRKNTLPFMLGPVGFLGLYRGRGEVMAAQAAKNKGIPLCLSTFSISSINTLRSNVGGDLHFQLYMDRDKSFVEDLLQSAASADVETLYLTVDTSVTSIRERDVRNGFRSITQLTMPLLFSMLQKPSWCIDMIRTGSPSVEALAKYPEFGKGALEQASNLSKRLDASLTWDDFIWLRDKWKKRLVLKGILSPEDAIQAKKIGADAIVISNHGGRQLDFTSSTISVLPAIREAVGVDFCLMIDGGFRRGSEIVIALALGANGVLLGRPYAFALAAYGRAGVEQAIKILSNEISITLKLMGVESVDELQKFGHKWVLPN